MALLIIDYITLVVKDLEAKRDSNQLSHLLMHPTNANIRQACLNALNDRIRKDEPVEENTLRAFFDPPSGEQNFERVIRKFERDKFRPLQSLIQGKIGSPNIITVELLAWLIDFKLRPLANAQRILANTYSTNSAGSEIQSEQVLPVTDLVETKKILQGETPANKEDLPVMEGMNAIQNTDDKRSQNASETDLAGNWNKRKQRIVACSFLVILLFFGTCIWQYERSKNMILRNPNTACMYWAGDQYEEVPCNEPPNGRLFLPLNRERLKNFKKITRPDTITVNSVGKIYCISVKAKLEFYTSDGNHPVEVTRTLKKLSRYIYDKHLSKKEDPGK